jgi:hypothetical protein
MNMGIFSSIGHDFSKAAKGIKSVAPYAGDGFKSDANKVAGSGQTSWNWTKGAVNTIGNDVTVAGQKCGAIPICNDIAMRGTQYLEDE